VPKSKRHRRLARCRRPISEELQRSAPLVVRTTDVPEFPLSEVAAANGVLLLCLRVDPTPPEPWFRLLAMRLSLAMVAAQHGGGGDRG
jgi:hypothetical protein